jgi:antitoxin component YwqK of YwqJK toxin-antitoxin module
MVKGQSVNGNKEGIWTSFSKDGYIEDHEIYFMDIKDSIHTSYFEDGSPRMTSSYFNDKMDGDCIMYAPGGELMVKLIYTEGELKGYQYMKEGKLTDIVLLTQGDQSVVAWYDNGNKSFEQDFGEFVAEGPQVKYYPDGGIMQRRQFSNGMLNGKCERYYPDGKPESVYYCKNGLYEGEYTEYHKSGIVYVKTQFLHDQRNGERTLFDQKGNPVSREKYWSGSFIGFKE